MEASPKPYSIGAKNANLYHNETFTSFFRRLTFTPDGSLLLTPAGQYQSQFSGVGESAKNTYEVINTVYIYTRSGINKPPIAHLPGHKKPSVVVKCSPIYYKLRTADAPTKHITIDTSSVDGSMPLLPEPVVSPKASPPRDSVMEPPPLLSQESSGPTSTPKASEQTMAFSLPYRIIYAVATQDSVLLYDTQQTTPICVVSNLHCATFTDLSW
jgi:chromatin assembly factor 1 subunit B